MNLKTRFTAVGLIGLALIAGQASAVKVTAVLSKKLPAYQLVLEGFAANPALELTRLSLDGERELGLAALSASPGTGASLLLAVGPEAAALAKANSKIPYLYTMVIEPQMSAAGVASGGVLMQVDLNDQILWLKKLFPEAKRVGVIYNPSSSGRTVNRARGLAEDNQLTLIPIAVESAAEVRGALAKLTESKLDLMWSVVDSVMIQPPVMLEVINTTATEKIPFVGLSESHVRAGALAAISVDYPDLGRQCSDLSARMLQPGYTPVAETLRKVIVFVNPARQKALGLQTWSRFSEIHPVE